MANLNKDELIHQFQHGESRDDQGNFIPYRLFIPKITEGETYPLVLFLHGSDERGVDNVSHLSVHYSGVAFADPEWQEAHPCFVLAPQVPGGRTYLDDSVRIPIFRALFSTMNRFPVDKNRIYITGLSMGGIGAWRYLALYPDLFAAAMPICGGADPFSLRTVKRIPIWAFHAADDPVVPASGPLRYPAFNGTRDVVRYLRGCGHTNIRYTEYPKGYMCDFLHNPDPGAAHAAWEAVYRDKKVLEWLFLQSLADQYETIWIRPGLWRIRDGMGDAAYLVEGEKRALLIDTAMATPNIAPLVKSLTHLPVELAITHAHGDHMAHAGEFGTVYLHPADKKLLPQFMEMMLPDKMFPPEIFHDIRSGEIIDLGGVRLEAVLIAGHTPGSVAFIDPSHQCIFTGDAIGSGIGVLMSIPGATALSEYRSNLIPLRKRLDSMPDYAIYGGHNAQEFGDPGVEQSYNPLCPRLIDDMITLCEKLIEGSNDITLVPVSSWSQEQAYRVRWGRAAMWVCKSQFQ